MRTFERRPGAPARALGEAVRLRGATIEKASKARGSLPRLHRQAGVGPVVVHEFTFLTALSVECDDPGSGYYVNIPLSGDLRFRHRGTDTRLAEGLGLVCQPGGGPLVGSWAARTHVLCVRLDPAAVNLALAAMLSDVPAQAPVFRPVMDTSRGPGREWAGLVLALSNGAARSRTLLSNPMVAAPLAETLVNGFLLAAGHSHSDDLAIPTVTARPAVVRTAIALIEDDPRLPLTVSGLAAHCGVSARTLQNGFRRHVGMSPMAYLRDTRLRRAHEELRATDPAEGTVAAIAQNWGFGHLGRFAAAYEQKYNQTPGSTLRDRRLGAFWITPFAFWTAGRPGDPE
jgi:AraC-like DNA-binding protein